MLLKTGTVFAGRLDQAQYTLQNDKSKLASLKQQAATRWPSSPAIPTSPSTEHPQYLQAQAQVDEARAQLDHTVVKAPFAGIVTNVPSIAPGKYLAASTPPSTSSPPIMSGSMPIPRRPS